MASTFSSTVKRIGEEPTAVSLRWRSWPVVDYARWSWITLTGLVALGGVVGYFNASGLLAIAVTGGLAAVLWQFFIPVRYEIGSRGLRRTALGRTRFVPWHAVQAYQFRATGVVLYRCPFPTRIDNLRSLFVPYPPDEDEALCAFREHLAHAVELPGNS